MRELPDAMAAEFDTVAGWTATVVEELGEDYALPSACRGSGSPAALAWLCEALQLKAGTTLLDAGAGVGGPGAFAAQRYGALPVLTDPMPEAVAAGRRLFGLPSLVCDSRQLPFPAGRFDAAWALGVLCTVEEKRQLLAELRRVLTPTGRLGLLVLVRTTDHLDEQPDGNSFPSYDELRDDLAATGFQVLDEADASDFPDSPVAWQAHVDRVQAVIGERHAEHPAFRAAEQQSGLLGRLLSSGQLRTVLIHAVVV
ncbi:MAG: Methyltransferase type 11, S-adenosyl-L-methionine-dependent [Frankiales bacterium]|jgi:SAM-dependent methyltransferase|nr:Methyltransferase type 11, S-adenosyl-L-methionine-dependent [Frankiales bacterium]